MPASDVIMRILIRLIPIVMVALGIYFIVKGSRQQVQSDKSRDLGIGIPLLIIGAWVNWAMLR